MQSFPSIKNAIVKGRKSDDEEMSGGGERE
jgi:hypothetical protein